MPLIAIVEDDASLRLGTVSLVRSADYEAKGFESAEAFLSHGAAGFACLVTDIQMSGLSGLDLLASLARDGAAMPTIVMTARKEDALRDRAMAAGAHCFLRKPFSGEELLLCIRNTLTPSP